MFYLGICCCRMKKPKVEIKAIVPPKSSEFATKNMCSHHALLGEMCMQCRMILDDKFSVKNGYIHKVAFLKFIVFTFEIWLL